MLKIPLYIFYFIFFIYLFIFFYVLTIFSVVFFFSFFFFSFFLISFYLFIYFILFYFIFSSPSLSQDNSLCDDDVLDSLFGGPSWEAAAAAPTSSRPSSNSVATSSSSSSSSSTTTRQVRMLDGNAISQGIALSPTSSWELVAASVVNSNLIMCRKCCSSQAIAFLLVHSTNRIMLSLPSRVIPVPSFVSARPIQSFIANMGYKFGCEQNKTPKHRTLFVRPVFSVVQSADHSWHCCTSITSKFYTALFGPEFTLAKEPVVLMGTQNGKVYYTNFESSFAKRQSEAEGGDVLGPLYDLEQPVVGLHWIYLPSDDLVTSDDSATVDWDMDGDAHEKVEETPNALICVGQRGKVVVCYFDPVERKCFYGTVEYQVPGPVLSSALAPKQCLLFTTLGGLYRVCLRQDCARCLEEKMPQLASRACSVKIPHVSFDFPEKVLVTRSVAYILTMRETDKFCQSDSGSGVGVVHCSYIMVDGSIATAELHTHADGPPGYLGRESRLRSADQVGKEMKQCLESIKVTNDRISQTRRSIESVGRALSQVKSNLELLCAVANVCGKSCDIFRSCAPFTCSLITGQHDQGLRIKKLFVDTTLTYKRPKSRDFPRRLGPGWNFLVKVTPCKDLVSSHSKSLSISEMASEDSVSVRTEVGHEELQLPVMVDCFLCYTPRMLSNTADVHQYYYDSSVSLHMCSRMFTVLNFATHSKEPCNTSSVSLSWFKASDVRHALAVNKTPSSAPVGPIHSVTLPVLLDTAITTILAYSTEATKENLLELNKKLLTFKFVCSILPSLHQVAKGEEVSKAEDVITCAVINGQMVSFSSVKASSEACEGMEASLELMVKSSCKQSLIETITSIHYFLNYHQCTNKPEKSKDDTDIGQDTVKGKLSDRAEEFKGIARGAGDMREELFSLQQQLKTKCLPIETHEWQIQSMKSKMFSAFCKLRELQHM